MSYADKVADCDLNKKKGQNLFKRELSKCDLNTQTGREELVEIVQKTCNKIDTDLTDVSSNAEYQEKREQYSVLRQLLVNTVEKKLESPYIKRQKKACVSGLQIIFKHQFQAQDFEGAESTLEAMKEKIAALSSKGQGDKMRSIIKETYDSLKLLQKEMCYEDWQACIPLLRQLSEQAHAVSKRIDDKPKTKKVLDRMILKADTVVDQIVARLHSQGVEV